MVSKRTLFHLSLWPTIIGIALIIIIIICLDQLSILPIDADEFRTPCEIARARRFRCETHHIVTRQDYILETHRILPLIPGLSPDGPPRPVILQHGLTGTSSNFLLATSDVSLFARSLGRVMAFELAKRGHDVWLPNNRGNRYSLRHRRFGPGDPRFWQFTFDDIAKYDTPAIVDYVRKTTAADKVAYVGHSQGTAVMFALLANHTERHQYQNIVQPFIAISPITRIGNATTTFRTMIAILRHYLRGTTDTGIFHKPHRAFARAKSLLCNVDPFRAICARLLQSICGENWPELDLDRLAVYTAHMPSSTSKRNLLHFDQLFSDDRFAPYNGGEHLTNNPEYDLAAIRHRSIHVIHTRNDPYVPLPNGIERLRDDLPLGTEFYAVRDPAANHCDPLFGRNVAIEVNHKIIQILRRYDRKKT